MFFVVIVCTCCRYVIVQVMHLDTIWDLHVDSVLVVADFTFALGVLTTREAGDKLSTDGGGYVIW